jgi:hypothetical protein
VGGGGGRWGEAGEAGGGGGRRRGEAGGWQGGGIEEATVIK